MSCPCSTSASDTKNDDQQKSSLVKNSGSKALNKDTKASAHRHASSSRLTSGDCILKFCLCGQASVGKTSLARRYVYGVVSQSMRPTIGLDFLTKSTVIDGNCVTVQIFDLQGQDLGGKTKATTSFYYRGSRGIMVVCDAAMLMGGGASDDDDDGNKNSNDSDSSYNAKKAIAEVKSWKADLDEKLLNHSVDEPKIPVFLLVNKIDIPGTKHEMDMVQSRAEKLKQECGFEKMFLVSAKTGAFVQESFNELVEDAL